LTNVLPPANVFFHITVHIVMTNIIINLNNYVTLVLGDGWRKLSVLVL